MKSTLIQTKLTNELCKAAVVQARKEEHDTFSVMQSELVTNLPIAKFAIPACKHPQPCSACEENARRLLVAQFSETVKRLHILCRNVNTMLESLVYVHVFGDKSDVMNTLRPEKVREFEQNLRRVSLSIPDVLRAELMIYESVKIHEHLLGAADEAIERLLLDLRTTLEELRTSRVIGSFTWFNPNVCKYEFFRVRRREYRNDTTAEKTLREEDGGAFTEYKVVHNIHHYKIVDVSERHEHQLFNAKRYRSPASNIRKPGFIHAFIQAIPLWMHPHVFIIEGDMLRESIDESHSPVRERREMGEEMSRQIIRTGRLYSPAVTLGDFVLTGWSGADL